MQPQSTNANHANRITFLEMNTISVSWLWANKCKNLKQRDEL